MVFGLSSAATIQKPNRPHFKQITKTELGHFNEQHWLHQLTKYFTKRRTERLQIGINDNSFSTLEKVNIQLMLRFLTTKFRQIKLIFGQDPPVDYNNEQKQTILPR